MFSTGAPRPTTQEAASLPMATACSCVIGMCSSDALSMNCCENSRLLSSKIVEKSTTCFISRRPSCIAPFIIS
ncbi:Uncharacterised protein [uncultured archaeon]|nr:Uncharacterised protein [uncultured archaeon]